MDPRIEHVARALCLEAGEHPDTLYRPGSVDPVLQGDIVVMKAAEAPRWQAYVSEARKHVVAFDILKET